MTCQQAHSLKSNSGIRDQHDVNEVVMTTSAHKQQQH
jgi:hypothetical protein